MRYTMIRMRVPEKLLRAFTVTYLRMKKNITVRSRRARSPRAARGKNAASRAQKIAPSAQGPQCFWVRDGKILRDLRDLETALPDMTLATYAHHVRRDKNDFADWVALVLGDDACARHLRAAKSKSAARKAVSVALAKYA